MKKGMLIRWLFLLLFTLPFGRLFSQVDSIELNNGIKSKIRVVAILDKTVQYTLPGDATAKVYSINKADIRKLYLNTNLNPPRRSATEPGTSVPDEKRERMEVFTRRLVGFNMGQMIYNSVSFSYQSILSDGVLGVKVYAGGNFNPRQLMLTSWQGTITDNFVEFMPSFRKYTFGAEFNLYPLYQRKVSYYVGPSFQLGLIDCRVNDGTLYMEAREFKNATNLSFVLNNGILVRMTPNFFIDLALGIGIQRVDVGSYGDFSRARGSAQVLMGYSF